MPKPCNCGEAAPNQRLMQRGKKVHHNLKVCRPRVVVCLTEIAGDFRQANSISSLGNGPPAGRFPGNSLSAAAQKMSGLRTSYPRNGDELTQVNRSNSNDVVYEKSRNDFLRED